MFVQTSSSTRSFMLLFVEFSLSWREMLTRFAAETQFKYFDVLHEVQAKNKLSKDAQVL
jgi:hypothetical protein